MARKVDKLSDKRIKAATARGIYGDGGGLYLQVGRHGHRSWIYRFQIHGRRRTMGLGPYPRITLKKARELHKAAAEQVHDGFDPIVGAIINLDRGEGPVSRRRGQLPDGRTGRQGLHRGPAT